MKLSDKIMKICKAHYNKFNECDCPIKDQCKNYRQQNIKIYEEFKKAFEELEKDEIK